MQAPLIGWFEGMTLASVVRMREPATFGGLAIATQIMVIALVAVAVGLGLTLLATASTRHRRSLWSGAWWSANGLSSAILGLTILVCRALGAADEAFLPSAPPPSSTPTVLWLGVFAGSLATAAAGVVAAWTLCLREVRRTIRGGLAPAYWMSWDQRWWWDGRQWVHVTSAIPGAALRSPGDTHWWNGSRWLALP